MALPSFLAGQGLGLGVGVAAGAFMPAVGRKIVSVVRKVVAKLKGEAKSVVENVAKKL